MKAFYEVDITRTENEDIIISQYNKQTKEYDHISLTSFQIDEFTEVLKALNDEED